jgi:hypothetical protein
METGTGSSTRTGDEAAPAVLRTEDIMERSSCGRGTEKKRGDVAEEGKGQKEEINVTGSPASSSGHSRINEEEIIANLNVQTESLGEQTESEGDQTECEDDQTESEGDQTESLADQTESLADQTESLADQVESLGDQRESLGAQTEEPGLGLPSMEHSLHALRPLMSSSGLSNLDLPQTVIFCEDSRSGVKTESLIIRRTQYNYSPEYHWGQYSPDYLGGFATLSCRQGAEINGYIRAEGDILWR